MQTEQIEHEMDAFAADRRYGAPSPMRAWFDARPELWAAVVARAVDGAMPAMTMYLYLVERHDFPFSESRFRQTIRMMKAGRRKGQAA